jgi:hypothetical protein
MSFSLDGAAVVLDAEINRQCGEYYSQLLALEMSPGLQSGIGDRDERQEYVWSGPKIKVSTIIEF